MRVNKTTFPAAEIVPPSLLEPLDFLSVFGRVAPLEVDLGCGDGNLLAALAQENPERNFLGVERLLGRMRSACRKIGQRELTNARVVRIDILHAVQQLLAPQSVDVFHLMFPDPWPKRRHQNRRVVTPEFLRAIGRALKPESELRITTDQADYFAEMRRLLLDLPGLFLQLAGEFEPGLPASTFGKRFRENGAEIYQLILRKLPGPLAPRRSNALPNARPLGRFGNSRSPQ